MSSRNLGKIPVYQKALELREISRAVAHNVSANKKVVKSYQSKSLRESIINSLINDAILIPEQIAHVELSNSHTERINSVSFINIMIRNINSYCLGLEKDGVKEMDYLNLLRSEIYNFRKSFTQWRRTISE